MDWNIDDYIKDFEEMGYTTEEAKQLIEEATRPVDISFMDEEFQGIIDKWNSIGCTSFRFTADELKKITKRAEWWINECGGVFCSNCGLYYDDYYQAAPDQCPKCNAKMYPNSDKYVHKDFRLSSLYDCEYKNESKYPQWLLELRNKYVSSI